MSIFVFVCLPVCVREGRRGVSWIRSTHTCFLWTIKLWERFTCLTLVVFHALHRLPARMAQLGIPHGCFYSGRKYFSVKTVITNFHCTLWWYPQPFPAINKESMNFYYFLGNKCVGWGRSSPGPSYFMRVVHKLTAKQHLEVVFCFET